MDSWFFYTAVYQKSIGYALPNCFFSVKDLTTIQKRALRAFLAKCGYNRNTQRTIVYAPIRYGGCGFLHLYLLQGEGQILTFLKHWRTQTDASRLLRISVSWIQLHLGIGYCCFSKTKTLLPHMPGRWLKLLRLFLSHIDGSLELDTSFIPPKKRAGDSYLMDLVLQSDDYSDLEIQRINYCRMYLNAITLSDLCLANGATLDRDMLNDHRLPSSSQSSWID
jgi:hypothetical protein